MKEFQENAEDFSTSTLIGVNLPAASIDIKLAFISNQLQAAVEDFYLFTGLDFFCKEQAKKNLIKLKNKTKTAAAVAENQDFFGGDDLKKKEKFFVDLYFNNILNKAESAYYGLILPDQNSFAPTEHTFQSRAEAIKSILPAVARRLMRHNK